MEQVAHRSDPGLRFLSAGGEMGRLMREFPWASSPLGEPRNWPQSLKSTLGACLNSPLLGTILWGDEFLMLYNDGYIPSMAERHPWALARPVAEVWGAAWEEVAADFQTAYANGRGFVRKGVRLDIVRHGEPVTTYWDFTATPIYGEDDSVVGLLNQGIETTEQVLTLRRLEHEKVTMQRLFEQAPSFMALLEGPEHRFTFVNEAYQRLIGRADVIGKTVREALPEAVRQGYLALLDDVYASRQAHRGTASEYGVEVEPGKRDVHYIDFIYQSIVDRDGQVTGVFVEGYDVTSRVRGEIELREHQQALLRLNADLERRVAEQTTVRSTLWELSTDLMMVARHDGGVLAVNPAAQQSLGLPTARPEGMWLSDLLGEQAVDVVRRRHDGAGQPLRWEGQIALADGSVRSLMWSANASSSDVVLVGRDVTDERIAERALRAAGEQLRQSRKMESIGQLTGGLAHDFNNLLTSMSGGVELIRLDLHDGRYDRMERCLAAMEASTQRAAAITHRLLAFARRQPLSAQPTDLRSIVDGMRQLLTHTMGPAIDLRFESHPAPWTTLVDANQLENALLNLCLNARDAMPEGGVLTVRVDNMLLPKARGDLEPGEYAALEVADTGTGIDTEIQERVFEPFFTTKPQGRGTGLGLSMVFGFARQSGGDVLLESRPGHGSRLTILLPRNESAAAASDHTVQHVLADLPLARDIPVLLVDDEDGVRMVVAEMLSEAGFAVIEASRAAEALDVLERGPRPTLLVTDVGLPGGMNGRQLADEVERRWPGIPVLFITGYADDQAFTIGATEQERHVLTKPFTMSDLVTRVRALVDA